MNNKYTNWYISEEVRYKAELSEAEAKDLADRAIRCPKCDHLVGIACEDLKSGHYKTKCNKCAHVFTINFGYFRRPKYGCYMFPFNFFYERQDA